MAFLQLWGNLPIIAKYYNMSIGYDTYVIASGGIGPITVLEDLGYTDYQDKIDFVKGAFRACSSAPGENVLILPCTPANPLSGLTAQNIYLSNYNVQDNTVQRYFLPNLELGLPLTNFVNNTSMTPDWEWRCAGVALYRDAAGEDLIGVQIIGFVMLKNNPDTIYNSPISLYDNVVCIKQLRALGYTVDIKLFDPDFGVPSEPDGYGQGVGKPTFDDSSDAIAIPDMPEIGISSAGFVNVYHVSQGALNNLGSIIFPAINLPAAAPTDVTEALTALLQYCQFFVDSLQNGKLIDYVVDCHIIPVAPADGAAATIHVGYKDTGISAPRVSSDYVDFDCGSISIGEYYANYIDYLTRARLFLPFVGFVDLKPEFWQSGTINVRYRFNVIDGSFMAYVKSTSSKSNLSDTVIGQYGGNSCVHIPLTGLNYSSFISGLVTGSMSLAASAASGNAAGAASSALSMLNNKPSVAQSNNYNASTSFLGVRCPYLMIERPVASFATEYARDKGLPLNVTVSLNSVSGYTVIDNIDFIGFDAATMDEVEEIRTLLQSGVIF